MPTPALPPKISARQKSMLAMKKSPGNLRQEKSQPWIRSTVENFCSGASGINPSRLSVIADLTRL